MVRTLVVDDESLARSVVLEFLDGYDQVQVIGECANGKEAVTEINEHKPDLVFLDIQMPGLNGFEVLAELVHVPYIIFSTANDSYAIDAFEAGALDYLLKPYSKERFDRAVERVLMKQVETGPELLDRLLHVVQPTKTYDKHLFVRISEKIFPVDTDEIIWIEAAGDYSSLHTIKKEYLCSQGIGSLEKRLDPGKFVRIHRSSIVALSFIDHIVSDGDGGYFARLKNGKRIKVSRSYAPRVRNWII